VNLMVVRFPRIDFDEGLHEILVENTKGSCHAPSAMIGDF